jgi:hypothetical protein
MRAYACDLRLRMQPECESRQVGHSLVTIYARCAQHFDTVSRSIYITRTELGLSDAPFFPDGGGSAARGPVLGKLSSRLPGKVPKSRGCEESGSGEILLLLDLWLGRSGCDTDAGRTDASSVSLCVPARSPSMRAGAEPVRAPSEDFFFLFPNTPPIFTFCTDYKKRL